MTEMKVYGNLSNREIYQQVFMELIDPYQLPYDESIELDAKLVHKLPIQLGHGAFGDVWLGCIITATHNVKETVAIKSPHNNCANEEQELAERESIRAEIKMMKYVGNHKNVLQLKGAVTTKKDQFWMITEYCQHGNLKSFLDGKKCNSLFIDEIVKHGDIQLSLNTLYKAQLDPGWPSLEQERKDSGFITTSDLFDFAIQIASGMDFLQEKGIVHRDLALRNILLTESFIVKICDFGLSRTTVNGYYKFARSAEGNLPIPVFSTAPESLKTGKALLESDWWTYGIVLWELFSLGAIPYIELATIRDLIEFLEEGWRLPRPEYSPIEIFILMNALWNIEPQNRPSLYDCKEAISRQLVLSRPGNIVNDCLPTPRSCDTLLSSFTFNQEMQGDISKTSRGNSILKKVGRSEPHSKWCTKYRYLLGIVFALVLAVSLTVVIINIATSSGTSKPIKESPTASTTVSSIQPLPPSTASSAETPQPDVTARTALTWIKWGNNEYIFVKEKTTWKAAETACVSWGGHLTSIHSSAENDFISSLQKGAWAWIGYNDIKTEGEFQWIDGTPTTYTNWSPNQPNNSGKTGEDCTVQDPLGDWNDDQCYIAYGYVCKR